MSLLSLDQYHFALCPDQVLFRHRKRLLRGRIENQVTWTVPTQDNAAPPWRAALETLRKHLPTATKRLPTASVVLANRFCHFALLRRSEELTKTPERLAYARHKLKTAYGDVAGNWILKLSNAGEQGGSIVSAIDGLFLEEIRTLFRKSNLPLISVQPYLAVVFNRCRGALEKRTAWFVVHEDGHLVVSLFSNGQWKSLASRRVGQQWKTELLEVLDREQQLLELEGQECNQVLLHAPQLLHAGEVTGGRYQVELLCPDSRRDLSDGTYAMAA